MYKQTSLTDKRTATVFLDPNTFSKDDKTFLYETSFSKDGRWLAYITMDSNDGYSYEIKVRNVETGKDSILNIKNVDGRPLAWTHDNKGFFYSVSYLKHFL